MHRTAARVYCLLLKSPVKDAIKICERDVQCLGTFVLYLTVQCDMMILLDNASSPYASIKKNVNPNGLCLDSRPRLCIFYPDLFQILSFC